jgi:hypothetical protein
VLRFVAGMLKRGMMKGELVRRSTGEKQTRVTISIWVAALHNRTSPQALLEARRRLPLRRQAQRPQLRRRREGRAAAHRDGGVSSRH